MKILEFPHTRQNNNFDCGAAALMSVLIYYGFDVTLGSVSEMAKTSAEHGTRVKDIVSVAKEYGLEVNASRMSIQDLKDSIDREIPVIIPLQAWPDSPVKNWQSTWSEGHYVVVIGYADERIIFSDPSVSGKVYLNIQELEQRWHDEDSYGNKYINFGIAIYGLEVKYSSSNLIHLD